jgi:RES domain-containing protein
MESSLMKSDTELRVVLTQLPTKPLSGITHRVVALGYASDPLNPIGSTIVGGRYNPKGEFAVLYLAANPETALLETNLALKVDTRLIGIPSKPRAFFTVHFDLRKTLDLQIPETQVALGTNYQELTGDWKYLASLHLESETQRLGRIVQELGQIDTLIVPSAKHSGHANLAVFTSVLTQTGGSVMVEDPDSLVKVRQLP